MIRLPNARQEDPRARLDSDVLAAANARASSPVALGSGITPGLAMGFAAILMLGGLTYASLSSHREAAQAENPATPPMVAQAPIPQPLRAPAVALPPAQRPNPIVPGIQVPPIQSQLAAAQAARAAAAAERLKAPAVVVDLTKGGVTPPAESPAAKADGPTGGDSAEDKFAERVAREEARPARAVRLTGGTDIVQQGTIISGVLETAINSDLPGFVRAVVSRDVSGFDGRRVLIPAGSRLVGQYRSGLSAGQSRAFVIWTRLIRPDGVSVSLASPVTDPLGRAGLGGRVDSHFVKRFGSAVLLSVVQAGLGRLSNSGNDVVVRTADDARSAAGIALQRDINIPPTVKVAQGTPIRVFTARDLDFSGADAP